MSATVSRPPRARPEFAFHLSCDVALPVQVRVDALLGRLPALRGPAAVVGGGGGGAPSASAPPAAAAAAFVVARLVAGGEELGIETKTAYAEAATGGCSWHGDGPLALCLKYRDLPCDAHLVLNVWQVAVGGGTALVGTAALPLFSKKGRLKTGPKQLRVLEGADVALLSSGGDSGGGGGDGGGSSSGVPVTTGAVAAATAAAAAASSGALGGGCRPPVLLPVTALASKPRVGARDECGQLAHLASLYARGDMPRCGWLDQLASRELARVQAADLAAAAASASELRLCIELPSFPHAVLYQQLPAPSSAAAAAPAKRDGAGGSSSALAAAGTPGSALDDGSLDDLIVIADSEVGRENPAELKAAKLARSLARGHADRDLKPNSDERRAIAAVLKLPPNRPLGSEERALLWRYRYSLRGDKRALTKFLKCVDWGDAYEARQAAELMGEWAPIEVADALELLSPDFKNDEVCAWGRYDGRLCSWELALQGLYGMQDS